MTAVAASLVDEIHVAEVRDAWRDYLLQTKGLAPHRYEEVEPWAWKRLEAKLRAIETRRRATVGRGRGLA